MQYALPILGIYRFVGLAKPAASRWKDEDPSGICLLFWQGVCMKG